ncbi:MAG: class I SAM-dependent methyltransferase [Pseudomonadota bacterium]|jgi:SAM-dependent methyltransferase
MSFLSAFLHFNTQRRDAHVATFAASLPAGTRVLDVGAGTCRYKPLFAHCDYRAQDFAKYEGSEFTYGDLDYVSDITAIPAPDAAFDAIVSTEVLEHVPSPELAVREMARLLAPGGRLLLTAPLGSSLHMMPYHFYGGFTPSWYGYWLPRAGLEVVRCEHNRGFFKSFGQESFRFPNVLRPEGRWARLAYLPLKLALMPLFSFAIPVLCDLLDRFETPGDFTVGYFVEARRV